MTYTATRTHEIACGHRVVGHEGKCRRLHGHNYVFELTCGAEELDRVGRVIDFGVIKERLCAWLEEAWDHRLLLWARDPACGMMIEAGEEFVPLSFNPTAENLARHLVEVVGPQQLEGTGVRLLVCKVHETGKCSAAYSGGRS